MSLTPIIRRASRQVWIGHVPVGGDAPVMIQSMTNTDTADAAATAQQVFELAMAGSEVVRGYCAAVRSAITDDGRTPLSAPGLKLKGRLEAVAESLDRVQQKGAVPPRRRSRGCAG